MSLTIKLSLVERTLNKLARCERKRSGDLLTRLREEADVLREAFEEIRAEERENCAKVAEDTECEHERGTENECPQRVAEGFSCVDLHDAANAIRARGKG